MMSLLQQASFGKLKNPASIKGKEGPMTELFQPIPMDMPATYRICVLGGLESSWAKRLWGMTSNPVDQTGEAEQTELVGEVADQAALVGIINALYNSGHTVISVERIVSHENAPLNDSDEQT